MVEIEETELIRPDGSISKHRVIRAPFVRNTYPNGTIEEISGLPSDFRVEQHDDDIITNGVSGRRAWRFPDYFLGRLFRRMEESGSNDLLPRSIALLNEHSETIIDLVNIGMFSTFSADGGETVVGYELTGEE